LPKALIATIGTGPGVEHAIANSIWVNRPDLIVFLFTRDSKPTVSLVKELLEQKGERLKEEILVEIEDAENIEECYLKSMEAIDKVLSLNYRFEEVCVDFTSGTKAMSAGLAIAAVARGLGYMVYVGGRRGKEGRVEKGKEVVKILKPSEVLTDFIQMEAMRLFNAHQFPAALSLLEQTNQSGEIEELSKLCKAYMLWDWFDHEGALEIFNQMGREVIEKWSNQIAVNKGWLNELVKNLKQARAEFKVPEGLLVDLMANAKRRVEEERWIDAVARLYRLTELIAQYRLIQKGIDSSNITLEKLPEELRESYRRKIDEEGKVKLGLEEDYKLLAAMGDTLGAKFQENKRLRNALKSRNFSIAGHGFNPVAKDTCITLLKEVEELLNDVYPSWREQIKRAEFPKLKA